MENTLADEMLEADKNKSDSEESSPEDFQARIFTDFDQMKNKSLMNHKL